MLSEILVKFLMLQSIPHTCHLTKSSFLEMIFKADLILCILVSMSLCLSIMAATLNPAGLVGGHIHYLIFATKLSLNGLFCTMTFQSYFYFFPTLILFHSCLEVSQLLWWSPVSSKCGPSAPHSWLIFCFPIASSKRATASEDNQK